MIDKQRFKTFGSQIIGDEQQRENLVKALEDSFLPDKKSGGGDFVFGNDIFSQTSSDIVKNLFSDTDFVSFIKSHPQLSENIQTEILQFLNDSGDFLVENNPFFSAEQFLDNLRQSDNKNLLSNIENIKNEYQNLIDYNSTINFDFYKNQYDEKIIETFYSENILLNEEKILARNFLQDIENEIFSLKTQWEIENIDQMRKNFNHSLEQRIENFQKLEEIYQPFVDNLGYLWDLSRQPFRNSGFEILQHYADILENDKSLQKLAEMLGRQNVAQARHDKLYREKIVISNHFLPRNAYRGQITGVNYSNDISAVLPSELALLKNPLTKPLFVKKFAEKQLFSFKYENFSPIETEETENQEVDNVSENEKGPIIICVDTSGSMHGKPETIAKTIVFALTKIALREKRKCYLISFSTDIQTLDLSNFKGGNGIELLTDFLRLSFNGGTDAMPALKHAVDLLKINDWKNADVLMVSDFVMPIVDKKIVSQIEDCKNNDINFYSLLIGKTGNSDVISCFNKNWFYDVSAQNSQERLVEQLETVARGRKLEDLS